jgi:GAF domain-containing protein
MFNETAKSLVLEACTDPSLLGTTIPLNHAGLVAQTFRSGKILLENSIVRQTAFTPTPGLRTAFSEVDIPLKFHTDILGILDIQSERMQAFSEDDLAILQITATQIVVAVRNAMSYDKIARLSQNISQN